ncbi:hypothetical protein MNB_SM-7-1315 [hydrothermal vent metagenome]|uniref:Uncharacterized protein n=1 Tax=hydrothermal vent metagenome TaxID=652676 RepID=A0A1W1BXL6_9ZZZZ
MFPLLIPAAVEAVEWAAGAYSAYKLSKAVKRAYKLSKVSKVNKYRKNNPVSKYNKRSYNQYDRVSDVSNYGQIAKGSTDVVSDVLGRYNKSRSRLKPVDDPNADVQYPEYTGETLIDAIKHSSDAKQVSTERIVNSLNLQSQMINDVASAVQSGTLVQSTMLPQIFSGLVEIGTSLERIASALENPRVVNPPAVNVDLQPVADAVNSLKPEINPVGRPDYYKKQNAIADYKTTPRKFTDIFGNDEVELSPLEIRARKDLSHAIDKALSNEANLKELDFFDEIIPYQDIEKLDVKLFSKLFKHNGVYTTLQDLVSNMGDNGQGFSEPELKE